jgi:hypothetical protein
MVQHIMACQRILLSGKFHEEREKSSGVGYILDFDASPLTPADYRLAIANLTTQDINGLVELAFHEAELISKELLKISVPQISPSKHLQLVSVRQTGEGVSDDEDESLDNENDDNNHDEGDSFLDTPDLSIAAASAARDTVRYSALCDDFEEVVGEAQSAAPMLPLSPPQPTVAEDTLRADSMVDSSTVFQSELVDGHGKISIERMLNACARLQLGTTTKSERVVHVDPKFALRRVTDATDSTDNGKNMKKMTTQEASQRVRVIQALAKDAEKEKKAREIRWQNFAKGLRAVASADGTYRSCCSNAHSG